MLDPTPSPSCLRAWHNTHSPSGHLYSREAIIEYLLTKTQELKKQRAIYEVSDCCIVCVYQFLCWAAPALVDGVLVVLEVRRHGGSVAVVRR
jgi:hypothetical protein